MPTKVTRILTHLSLRNRLMLAALIWLSAMILAAGVVIPTQVYSYMVDETKSQLNIYMDELAANLETNNTGQLAMLSELSDPRFRRPYSGLYWSIEAGNHRLRSRSLWDRTIESQPLKNNLLGARNEPLIHIEKTLYLPEYREPVQVTIGIDEKPIRQSIAKLRGQLWVILGLLFIGLIVVMGVQVYWSLAPLRKLQKELVKLRAGEQNDLHQEYPQEIAPVISDLNALLFHYQELLDRARHHAGNLSHALKTPISVLRNEVAALDQQDQEKLQLPLQQIQQQIDYHLSRARMAGSKHILSVKSSPSLSVDTIGTAFDKLYSMRGVTLVNELDSETLVAVDENDLNEMLGNLLENSYKWAASLIRVHQQTSDSETVSIVIEDDGPGIPEPQRQQALKRGIRLDESTPGSGLGLNIVSEMAHSYRGNLTLECAELGGVKAILTLQRHQPSHKRSKRASKTTKF
ncbi:ATP-binding protein [Vibrio sp. AK197]